MQGDSKAEHDCRARAEVYRDDPVHCWYTFSLKNGVDGLPNRTGTTCEPG
jgi:hypothetical protein